MRNTQTEVSRVRSDLETLAQQYTQAELEKERLARKIDTLEGDKKRLGDQIKNLGDEIKNVEKNRPNQDKVNQKEGNLTREGDVPKNTNTGGSSRIPKQRLRIYVGGSFEFRAYERSSSISSSHGGKTTNWIARRSGFLWQSDTWVTDQLIVTERDTAIAHDYRDLLVKGDVHIESSSIVIDSDGYENDHESKGPRAFETGIKICKKDSPKLIHFPRTRKALRHLKTFIQKADRGEDVEMDIDIY